MSSAISSPLAAVCDDLDRGVHALVNVAVVGVCAGFGEGEAVRFALSWQRARAPAEMSSEATPMRTRRRIDWPLAISMPAIRRGAIPGWVIFQNGVSAAQM